MASSTELPVLLLNRAPCAKLGAALERLAGRFPRRGFIEDHVAADILGNPGFLIVMHGRKAADVACEAFRRRHDNVVILTNGPFYDISAYKTEADAVRRAAHLAAMSEVFYASFGCWDAALTAPPPPPTPGRWRELAAAAAAAAVADPLPWRVDASLPDVVLFSSNPLGFQTRLHPGAGEAELVRRWIARDAEVLGRLLPVLARHGKRAVVKPHPSTRPGDLDRYRAALDRPPAVVVLDLGVPIERIAARCLCAVVFSGASCVHLCRAGVPMFSEAAGVASNVAVDGVALPGAADDGIAALLEGARPALPAQEAFLDAVAARCYTAEEVASGALTDRALDLMRASARPR